MFETITPRSSRALFGRRSRLMIGVSTLVLSLAACGGGTPAPTGAQPTSGQPTGARPTVTAVVATQAPPVGARDMCALATTAEVSTAFGFQIAAATPSADDNYDTCTYTAADGAATVTTSASKTALAFGQYSSFKNSSGNTPVAGVGDDATWTNLGLLFIKGSVMVTINGNSAARNAAEHQDGSEGYQMAATAVGKAIAAKM